MEQGLRYRIQVAPNLKDTPVRPCAADFYELQLYTFALVRTYAGHLDFLTQVRCPKHCTA
jgi:hypothetical protein